jgi:hypothetical protein
MVKRLIRGWLDALAWVVCCRKSGRALRGRRLKPSDSTMSQGSGQQYPVFIRGHLTALRPNFGERA